MPNFFRDMPKIFFDNKRYKMYIEYVSRMSRFFGTKESYFGTIKHAGVAYIAIRFIALFIDIFSLKHAHHGIYYKLKETQYK